MIVVGCIVVVSIVAILVVVGIVLFFSINVHLKILEITIEFGLWVGGGGEIIMSNYISVELSIKLVLG